MGRGVAHHAALRRRDPSDPGGPDRHLPAAPPGVGAGEPARCLAPDMGRGDRDGTHVRDRAGLVCRGRVPADRPPDRGRPCAAGAGRGSRLRSRHAASADRVGDDTPRGVLLVGAGEAGVDMARQLHNRSGTGMSLVGYLDDDPLKQRLTIAGYRVLGRVDDLPHVVAEHAIDEVLIAMPSASGRVTPADRGDGPSSRGALPHPPQLCRDHFRRRAPVDASRGSRGGPPPP